MGKYQHAAGGKNAGWTSETNSCVPCEQRRFWSSWPQDVALGTKESPLSGPCWQDPRSTGVVLQWEAAVSVEQTDPAMECHTSQDISSPTEGAMRPMSFSSLQQGIPLHFVYTQRNTMGGDFIYAEPTLTRKPIHILIRKLFQTQLLHRLVGRKIL